MTLLQGTETQETGEQLIERLGREYDFELIGENDALINEYYNNKIGDLEGHRTSALKIGKVVLEYIDKFVGNEKENGKELVGIAPVIALRGAVGFFSDRIPTTFKSVANKVLIAAGVSRNGKSATAYLPVSIEGITRKGLDIKQMFGAFVDMGIATGGTGAATLIDMLGEGFLLENIGVFGGVMTEYSMKRINGDVAKYLYLKEIEGLTHDEAKALVMNEKKNPTLKMKEGVRVRMRALTLGRMPIEINDKYKGEDALYITQIMVNKVFIPIIARDWGNEIWTKFEQAGESARYHIRYYLSYLRNLFTRDGNGIDLSVQTVEGLEKRHFGQAGIEA